MGTGAMTLVTEGEPDGIQGSTPTSAVFEDSG